MEVHAQLNTASKIFCGCPTRFGAEPNTQTCPICLGMPGVLPVLNKRVVEMGIALGLATNSQITPCNRFARKNYFYPDLPKGYQISQFELPICEKGHIDIAVNGKAKRIGLTRIHMEEDAGKNIHEGHSSNSQVDLNRAGVPLLEIVSEPEIFSAEEAVAYLKTLRDILVYLSICNGNMEQGNFRCEPNISLRPVGQKAKGNRVEVKNINSFRFVQKAVAYEVKRQEEILREGGRVVQVNSQVDLNRAGVPLLEIVSEPEIFSAEEAVAYLKTLRDILVYLSICNGNMEQGNFRCEPNISLRPVGQKAKGNRVEVKNINSFRFVQKAVAYEVKRQEEILREGGRVVQETRLWNSAEGVTASMRSKEDAHDYRYFPEPDLVPLMISNDWIEKIRASLPELPVAKRERFVREFEIPAYDAEVLTSTKDLADYFEACVRLDAPSGQKRAKTISNWIMSELLREIKLDDRESRKIPLSPENLIGLLQLIDKGTINGKIAKDIIPQMYRTGKSAALIVEEQGLTQVSDEGALESIIDQVMEANPKEVQGYRAGKEKLIGFFVGQVMKASRGKGHPGKVNELLKKKLAQA